MPAEFRRAVGALRGVPTRRELRLTEADPPPRLAPWSFALRGEIGDAVVGRLVLLHDPASQPDWQGVFRLVCYLSAELDPEQAGDEALPAVAWSWLTEALDDAGAEHVALRGTVTRSSSVRFEDGLAGGTAGGDGAGIELGVAGRTDDVELRCSWTPTCTLGGPVPDWHGHAAAFVALLGTAAGLPPVGVADLGKRPRMPAGSP
jgi:Protein of unknown function (DUF3000)